MRRFKQDQTEVIDHLHRQIDHLTGDTQIKIMQKDPKMINIDHNLLSVTDGDGMNGGASDRPQRKIRG